MTIDQLHPVMMLARIATGCLGSPLPQGPAAPVDEAERAVAEPAGGAWHLMRAFALDVGQLHADDTTLSVHDCRVQQPARETPLAPTMRFVPIHVDQVSVHVGAAKQYVAGEGAAWLEARHSGGNHAGFRPGGGAREAGQGYREQDRRKADVRLPLGHGIVPLIGTDQVEPTIHYSETRINHET